MVPLHNQMTGFALKALYRIQYSVTDEYVVFLATNITIILRLATITINFALDLAHL